MCAHNEQSLIVSYIELENFLQENIETLINDTENFLQAFNAALQTLVNEFFPNYKFIKNYVYIRLKDVPLVENIRSLRKVHLKTLIKVRGVVTKRSSVFPQLSLVMYHCNKCDSSFGPLLFESNVPKICISCQSKGPHTIVSSETVYKDLQRLTIQEVPGTVPFGRLPRQKEVHLFYDLIDIAKPGDEVEITGIYKNVFSNQMILKNSFPIFSTVIEAINVEKKEDEVFVADIKEILKLSKHPQIKNIIINSIAPYIYGHKNVKKSYCSFYVRWAAQRKRWSQN